MKKIKNIELLKTTRFELKPSDLSFVIRMELTKNKINVISLWQQKETSNSWPNLSEKFYEVNVIFFSVSNIKIDFSGSFPYQVSGFDIIDVSENGWEGINFQVEDYEHGCISFNCEEIEIVSVKE